MGQPRECYVYYLYYYKYTMQHRAMHLMSKKMAAALAPEGEFSEDGLAAMAGDDNMEMALAKSMAETIDQADMQRSWSKIKSGDKKQPRKEQAGLAERSKDAKPTPLGTLPIAALAERFAQAYAGTWAAAHTTARGVELEPVAADPETGAGQSEGLRTRSGARNTRRTDGSRTARVRRGVTRQDVRQPGVTRHDAATPGRLSLTS
jgi:hypothetical protein